MHPTRLTPLWIQRIRWTCLGLKARWPLPMTKSIPRPEKTVRCPIHLNPRNKARRGRSAAMMDLPIGCKSLVDHISSKCRKLTLLKSCLSGGNAPTLKSQTRTNSTSNDNWCLMVRKKLMSQFISFARSIRRPLTWESDNSRKFTVQRTTSPISIVAVKKNISESKTDRMVCRKFSRSMSQKGINQRLFSLPRLFLITT